MKVTQFKSTVTVTPPIQVDFPKNQESREIVSVTYLASPSHELFVAFDAGGDIVQTYDPLMGHEPYEWVLEVIPAFKEGAQNFDEYE